MSPFLTIFGIFLSIAHADPKVIRASDDTLVTIRHTTSVLAVTASELGGARDLCNSELKESLKKLSSEKSGSAIESSCETSFDAKLHGWIVRGTLLYQLTQLN